MAPDGSFPPETKRTKPYGYSLFNLDALATLCQILNTTTDNRWAYQTPDGRGIRKGIEFLFPFVRDKNTWPFPRDVMYWNDWPVAPPFLVFGAVPYGSQPWLSCWQHLNHAPDVPEVVRNLPVRNPLIWLN